LIDELWFMVGFVMSEVLCFEDIGCIVMISKVVDVVKVVMEWVGIVDVVDVYYV